MRKFRYALSGVATQLILLGGCALSPYQLDDPNHILGQGPKASDVVKSLRCEIITYLVDNRIRSAIHSQQHDAMVAAKSIGDTTSYATAIELQRNYSFIPIDATQYAALTVDLKNVDSLTLSLGYDWKKPSFDSKTLLLKSADYRDYHVGPSYGETNTFELIQTIGLPQNADLGPAQEYLPKTSLIMNNASPNRFDPTKATGAYFFQPVEDQNFYCFSSLKRLQPHDIIQVEGNLQDLVTGGRIADQLTNFNRIHVGVSGVTLAKWLQNVGDDITSNQITIFSTPENILGGQFEYTFTLDVKPSIDLKYSLVASLVNPLIPEISGAIEHSSQFAIYLNTPYSLYAFGAKQGNSCNPQLTIDEAHFREAHLASPFNSSCKQPGAPAPVLPKPK